MPDRPAGTSHCNLTGASPDRDYAADMDWSLRACSRKGHVTYAPTEPALRERLLALTPAGEAWRCLRCWDFTVGAAGATGPAADAPVVLRGKALREAFVLRLLAVERFIRFLVIGLLGYAVVRFSTAQTSLQQLFTKVLPRAKPLASVFNYNLDRSPSVARLQSLLHSRPDTLHLVAGFLFAYAAIELLEGVGLWSLKRWGEYVAVVATASFLPIEIYELSKDVTVLKVVAFLINIALVIYLVLAKHLFGARGGRAAYDAHRQSESLLEVEGAAVR